jgi:HAD superfamily hydrolase (TIGR01509 family)
MLKEQHIKNILFDLGGVILDIDVHATLKGFYELGFPSELLQYPNNMTSDLFFRYETGKLGTVEFRNEIRKITGLDLADEALDEAWNAMILRIPAERTQLIEKLKGRYELYMLSNTSPLHVPVFEQMYLEKAEKPMKDYFKKIYYSYEIGWHKPDNGAWEYVIKDAGLVPEETLFLDDNIHNIKASQELGFQAIHIHERTRLNDLGFDL